jgi:hypothetical protein
MVAFHNVAQQTVAEEEGLDRGMVRDVPTCL